MTPRGAPRPAAALATPSPGVSLGSTPEARGPQGGDRAGRGVDESELVEVHL
ncbi:MAG: hypothetical protein P8M11_03425 [Planctomycetota bacterium]|nr:hypothetical protein [Planctomycetota bacterium]MDG1983595.1 hypothetical protein [Planctomycetota bacterium]